MLLRDKSVLVVPGTFGIGFQAARRFAQEGAKLLLCGESERNGERALELLRQERPGVEVRFQHVILTEEAGFEQAVEEAVKAYGVLDACFGCPDHFTGGLLADLDPGELDLTVERNARSLFFLTKHTAPAMMASGGGALVFLSSMYAKVSGSMSAAYEVSKGLVSCMARSFGEIYAPMGVRINCVLPGHYTQPETGLEDEHPVFRAASAADALAIAAHYPLRRFADPEEIVAAALWLLSDQASYAVGTELLLDGGLTLR